MVPGNAPMKAALVRYLQILLVNRVLGVAHHFCQSIFVCTVGECLVVGQSHFKTFDNKFFTFTGHCQYLLARDCADTEFSVIIENVQVMFCLFFFFLDFVFFCSIVFNILTKLYEE